MVERRPKPIGFAIMAIIYWVIHERMMNRETLQEASYESDSA